MAESVSYIGSGASRQGRGVDYSGSIFRAASLVEANRRTKLAGEGKEKLINLDDFGIDQKSLLPRYAKNLGDLTSRAANDYVEIKKRVGDPYKARNIWEAEYKPKYQEEINAQVGYNNATKAYLDADPTKYEVGQRAKVLQGAHDTVLSGEEWAKTYNNPDNGIMTTPTYGFGAVIDPRVDFSEIIKKYNTRGQADLTKPKTTTLVGNQTFATFPVPADERDVALVVNEIAADEANLTAFNKKILPTLNVDPELLKQAQSENRGEKIAAQRTLIGMWAKEQMGSDYTTNWDATPPQPSGDDKNRSRQTMGEFNVPVNFTKEVITGYDNKGAPSTEKKATQQVFPYLRNFNTTKQLTITNTDDIFDATTSYKLKDAPTTFNIIPSGNAVFEINTKAGKKKILATMGTMIDYKEPDYTATEKALATQQGRIPSREEVINEMLRNGKATKDKTVLAPLKYTKGALEQQGINTKLDEDAFDLIMSKEKWGKYTVKVR